jgi:hypothetical protein
LNGFSSGEQGFAASAAVYGYCHFKPPAQNLFLEESGFQRIFLAQQAFGCKLVVLLLGLCKPFCSWFFLRMLLRFVELYNKAAAETTPRIGEREE